MNINHAVSAHFTYKEMACRCCGSYSINPKLLLSLEWFRTLVSSHRSTDTPLIINSAYRCPQHNAAVGGSKNSQHMLGNAADVRIPTGLSPRLVVEFLERIPYVGGIGLYSNFVHIDIRPRMVNGTREMWSVGASGKMEPIEKAYT